MKVGINGKNGANRIAGFCFAVACLLFLAGCSIYIYVMPDQSYSAAERRMLAKRPKVTKKRVLSGKFQKDYEVYLSEQFPGRTRFVSLQARLSRLLGERDANGVYFGSGQYLLERYQEQDFDWKLAKKNVRRASKFLQEYPNARILFVPVKSSVLSEKLPMFAEISGEGRFFELVAKQIPKNSQIPVADALVSHNSEYIYYRTDHHWTTHGAYYAYVEWARSMGFDALPKENFTVTDVCSTFLGTTYAKVRTGGQADTISLYEPKEGPSFSLDYNMGEFQSDSFYDLSKLEGDDAYSVFFGGNQAFVDIRSNADNTDGRTLMIIKDSFGNCFAPFAANHYERTIVVDLRHVNIPVGRLLQAYPADDILILYNSVQFMEDKNLSKLQ